MCKGLTLIILFLLFVFPLFGQPVVADNQIVRTVTVEDGLPQGWVTDIVQDQQGFIWIASKGISRFAGHSFVHYQHTEGDSSTILSNQIGFLKLDSYGNLWITYGGDITGIDIINTITGRVRHISSEPNFAWMNPPGSTIHVVVQLAGQYFGGTYRELVAFHIHTGRHKTIALPASENILGVGSMPGNQVAISTLFTLYTIKNYGLEQLAFFLERGQSKYDVKKLFITTRVIFYPIVIILDNYLFCPDIGGT